MIYVMIETQLHAGTELTSCFSTPSQLYQSPMWIVHSCLHFSLSNAHVMHVIFAVAHFVRVCFFHHGPLCRAAPPEAPPEEIVHTTS